MRRSPLLVLLAASLSLPLSAQIDHRQPGVFVPRSALEVAVSPAPPLRATATPAPVVLDVQGMGNDEVMTLRAENAKSPTLKVGRIREAGVGVQVGGKSTVAASDLPWRWRGAVRVEGASRVRLRLDDLRADPSVRFWLYSEFETQAFTPALAADGVLWTPSVRGETVTLEVESASSVASFKIGAVADIRGLADVAPESSACIMDARCYPGSFLDRRSAYAFYLFLSNGDVNGCSGALLADDNGVENDYPPYFLTANHCIGSASEASSVEVFWDYNSAYCNAPRPALESLPRTSGSTLLVTSSATDVTLLRLNSMPGGRWLMGWDPRSATIRSGLSLFRISYPNGVPSSYSQSLVNMTSGTCSSTPRPSYIYATNVLGATDVGSSGAPAFYAEGDGAYVVGQLLGACGPDPSDVCNYLNLDTDGSFAASWPLLQPFLRPTTTGNPCVAGSTTACLLSSRFEVTIDYRNQFANPPQTGRLATQRLDPAATNPDTALFGFGNPKAVEAVVRIVDARPYAPRFDVYHGGLTDVEYWVNVRDTKTGVTRRYHKAPGEVAGGVDRASFPTP